MLVDEFVKSVNEFENAAKHSTAQSVFREVGKEAFGHFEPGRTCGREVNMEAGLSFQPALNLRVLVSGVIVGHEIEFLVVRRGLVDQAEELDPLLMPVPLRA